MAIAPAQAILLAAGRGQRLGALGADMPKCLLSFADHSLLERHLQALESADVARLAIVTGFQCHAIEVALQRIQRKPAAVQTVFNPRYERGSALSLWCARELLQQGTDVLLMDADVLYDPAILEPLLRARASALLFDREFDDTGNEAVKVCVRDGGVVEFRKQVAPGLRFDEVGESVGFFRLSASLAARLARRLDAYVAGGRLDEPYEEALRDLMLEDPEAFAVCDITGIPWREIDFPQDVERARRDVLPRLARISNAAVRA